jgi:heptosyltransferase-1
MSGKSQTQPERILIVRLGAMGDVLHAMPAVAALRKAKPEARIGWVVERRWSELVVAENDGAATISGLPLIDILHTVDTRGWRRNLLDSAAWRDIRGSLAEIRAERYDIAIDFQGAIKSALLAKVSGASEIVGFTSPRERMATMWYTSQAQATAAHVIDQNLQLASAVARTPLQADLVELSRSVAAEQWCDTYLWTHGLTQFAILNPGSGWGAKSWPGHRYAEVASRLHKAGLRSLINFGPGEDSLARSVVEASGGAAEAVNCNLAQLIALTRRAALFIGGDTGPMHLAAALKVPTVALFGPTDPARNGPYWKPSVVLRSARSVTSYRHVSQSDPGLHSITADVVITAVTELLGVAIV